MGLRGDAGAGAAPVSTGRARQPPGTEHLRVLARAGRVPAPPRPLRTGRAAKQRRKGDRIVIDCQEQAYWLVNRPPVRTGWGGGRGVPGWWVQPWAGRCHGPSMGSGAGGAGGLASPWHDALVAARSPQRAGAGP